MNERLKELAVQAGFAFSKDYAYVVAWDDEIERFAELVRQDERELAKPEQWGDSAISDPVSLNAQRDINGAIRQLVQTEQELVKCTCDYAIGHPLVTSCSCKPRKTWVGLTDDEIKEVLGLNESSWSLSGVALQHVMDDARALEAKLKEKNT
jgi:hypothetical protein